MRKAPTLTVDVVILLDVDHEKGVVLVKRGRPPFEGYWALPGGHVEYGERVEDAAKREALEETGLNVELLDIVGVYSDPNRDPRGHYVTIAYLARPVSGELKASGDAANVRVFGLNEIPWDRLAFDHSQILRDALEKARKLSLI